MRSNIVLCADDFGLAPGVSEGIAELVRSGRLSAVGCMTVCDDWPTSVHLLHSAVASSAADVGLHLTLTDHRAASGCAPAGNGDRLPPLGRLMLACLARRVSETAFRAEIHAQLDTFEAHWGGPPDFVDGHQHVHILPGVREALVGILRARYRAGTVWVRNCVEPPSRCLRRGLGWRKALLISALGLGWRRLASAAALPMNDGFSGLHDFNGGPLFREKMKRFLSHRGPHHLVHVHPGRVDAALRAIDPLTTPREAELHYLLGKDFLHDLDRADVSLARFERQN